MKYALIYPRFHDQKGFWYSMRGSGACFGTVAVGWLAGYRGEGTLAPIYWGKGPLHPMAGMVRSDD